MTSMLDNDFSFFIELMPFLSNLNKDGVNINESINKDFENFMTFSEKT